MASDLSKLDLLIIPTDIHIDDVLTLSATVGIDRGDRQRRLGARALGQPGRVLRSVLAPAKQEINSSLEQRARAA